MRCSALYILTYKGPWCHSGARFFDIWASKSGLSMRCFVHVDLQMDLAAQRRAIFRHLSVVPFFRIRTSKMAPKLRCFVKSASQICFSQQRRAIFRDRHFQNWSRTEVCAFWLTNALRATAACHFWRYEARKVARTHQFNVLASHESFRKHSFSRLS